MIKGGMVVLEVWGVGGGGWSELTNRNSVSRIVQLNQNKRKEKIWEYVLYCSTV